MARSQGLLHVAAQKTFTSLRTSYAKRGRVLLSVGRAITANYWGDRLAIPQLLLYVDVSPTPCSAVSPRVAAVSGKHGSVFTHRPALWNPYTIRFSRYSVPILTAEAKSGNRPAGAGFNPMHECRGLQARCMGHASCNSIPSVCSTCIVCVTCIGSI